MENKTIKAFNYPNPLFKVTRKRKAKMVKSETIKKKAQRILKTIGLSKGIVSGGRILVKSGYQEYRLEFKYFGIPEDLPEGTEIDFSY